MKRIPPLSRRSGFSLVEMMAAVAVMGILAMIAIPGIQVQYTRRQIIKALPLADLAKAPVAAAWAVSQTFPSDNADAGLPVADKIVSNWVSSVAVENGAVQITFGNHASGFIKGKVLSLRPAIVEDAPIVPVAWVCGAATPPDPMTVQGENRSTVEKRYLPLDCQ